MKKYYKIVWKYAKRNFQKAVQQIVKKISNSLEKWKQRFFLVLVYFNTRSANNMKC